jgi:thioredoxin 1
MEKNEYNKNLNKKDIPSNFSGVIRFFAGWCGPCRILDSYWDEIKDEIKLENPNMNFLEINTDEKPDIPAKYKVLGIPCVILLKNGEEIHRIHGLANKDVYLADIKTHLGNN